MSKQPIINPENEDFGAVLNCAVRYACGRETYMPSIVIGFIRPLIPYIDNKTLCCMERDIRDARSYGNERIDKPDWIKLLSELQSEINKRELRRW